MPLNLTDLAGVIVDEQESLLADTYRNCIDLDNKIYKSYIFKDMLLPISAESLVKWYDCPFGNYSAITVNNYGQESVTIWLAVLKKNLLKKI